MAWSYAVVGAVTCPGHGTPRAWTTSRLRRTSRPKESSPGSAGTVPLEATEEDPSERAFTWRIRETVRHPFVNKQFNPKLPCIHSRVSRKREQFRGSFRDQKFKASQRLNYLRKLIAVTGNMPQEPQRKIKQPSFG